MGNDFTARQPIAFVCPAIGMKFIEVPGGTYDMETNYDSAGYEITSHRVTLDRFLMGKHPVTQEQWEKVMGSNPSEHKGANLPVENVSFFDCEEFIDRLNEMSGRLYRLPTEAEWEYAARSGGKQEKWAGCNSESELPLYAWYADNSIRMTHPVGQKRPNGLGLHDMSGNVEEWCKDEDGVLYNIDCSQCNVIRGGGVFSVADNVRTAYRNDFCAAWSLGYIGFRLVTSVQ